MKITVLNNQTLFDLAVRYCGSSLAAFQIANENKLSVSTQLRPGQIIEIPEHFIIDKTIAFYFNSNNHQPATAWDEKHSAITPKLEGISYWALNDEFMVSNSLQAEEIEQL